MSNTPDIKNTIGDLEALYKKLGGLKDKMKTHGFSDDRKSYYFGGPEIGFEIDTDDISFEIDKADHMAEFLCLLFNNYKLIANAALRAPSVEPAE